MLSINLKDLSEQELTCVLVLLKYLTFKAFLYILRYLIIYDRFTKVFSKFN